MVSWNILARNISADQVTTLTARKCGNLVNSVSRTNGLNGHLTALAAQSDDCLQRLLRRAWRKPTKLSMTVAASSHVHTLQRDYPTSKYGPIRPSLILVLLLCTMDRFAQRLCCIRKHVRYPCGPLSVRHLYWPGFMCVLCFVWSCTTTYAWFNSSATLSLAPKRL